MAGSGTGVSDGATTSSPPGTMGTALVTGATAGIGAAFARRLAARGHDLVLVARDQARLEALAAELRERHAIQAEALGADLSDDDGVERVVGRIAALPTLAVLVNNAGFGTAGALATAPVEVQERMVRLHVLAPMRLTRAALPGLLAHAPLPGPLARPTGAVVNVSSVASFIYAAGSVNYCATKAYLTTFSEGLGAELAGTGVQVQALCPGFTRTEFHQRIGPAAGDHAAWMWLTADAVVRASLAQLDRRGPVICVPGLHYKLLVAVVRLLPRRLIGMLSGRGYRRM
jgi:short-subunit dehydrogenase